MRGPLLSLLPVSGAAPASGQDVAADIVLGQGRHTYRWVRGWGRLPGDELIGSTHGCIAVDKEGLVYVNTDTESAVIVFDAAGRVVRTWGGKEFAGGLHGMTLVEEDDVESLYLTHTKRHGVVKATLDGEVLWALGYPEESGIYEDGSEFIPTNIAVAPNGDFYVADGYGRSWVHHYDKERKYLRSFGGFGTRPGQMRTPHGIFLDRRGDEPTLIVADRENHRLQIFDLQGRLLRRVEGILRRPCNVQVFGDDLVVADLLGRVTILDKDFKVIAHLGDNPDETKRANFGVPVDQWKDGLFTAPHSACWDQAGNLYVMDWVDHGRVTKLEPIKRGG